MTSSVPICPTSPLVPMPAPLGMFCMPNMTVAKGARIAPVKMGGSHSLGFLTRLGSCIMLVPRPQASAVPMPLSLWLMTAKPIIWAAQPTVAAPAPRPLSPKLMAMAALDTGKVSSTPMTTATIMLMMMGLSPIAHVMTSEIPMRADEMSGLRVWATTAPVSSVVRGVTMMSSGVVRWTNLPHSAAMMTATNAPIGLAPMSPTVVQASITKGGALMPYATPTPMATPIMLWA